jgi:EAL domain-containing protein (putative c-di-GMP-specific phosphodiesterase class I)/GGDEF domain-containing protein
MAAGCNRHAAKCAERILLSQALDQDAVTGLPDRRRFAADVARLQERDPGMALALIVIAIDDLELVKRTLGHAAADSAIVASARRLQAAMREPRHQLRQAVLFRVDDRLAVLWCEQATSPADLVAAHLLKAMEADISLAGQYVRLAGHAGIAVLGAEPVGSSAAEDPRSPQFVANLSCVFQPQWALQGNRLIGLEALARWRDPELGSVSPAEFIPLAEEDPEVANRLADWMLLSACRQRRGWRALISDEVRVAVNFSATQLQTGDLHERIRNALAGTGLPPALFEVEITESACAEAEKWAILEPRAALAARQASSAFRSTRAIADFAHSIVGLRELRQQGVGVAIDDFGVGYSSLSYLAELPATCLKVDRAFVQGIEHHRRRIDLLRGICSLGHAMHMSVIVEGVESLGIAAWLRTVGCDAAQGFAISRPLLAAAFPEWYKRESPSIAAALVDAESGHPESRVTA